MGNEQFYFQRVSMSENTKFDGKIYSELTLAPEHALASENLE